MPLHARGAHTSLMVSAMSYTAPLFAPTTAMCPKRRPPRPKHPNFTHFHRGGLQFGRMPPQHRAIGGRRNARLRWPWAVAGPGRASTRGARLHISDPAPLVWRAPEGPEGTGGLRGAAPNAVRPPSLAGGRGLRRPEHPWGHKRRPDKATAHSEGPEAPQRLGPLARTCVSCSQVELNVAAGDGFDQLARVVLDRVVEQLVRRVGLDELALLHDDHVVGDLADNGQVVRDE